MELQHIEKIQSPESGNKIRLVGKVNYDKSTTQSERYWFEVQEDYADFLSQTGNPWLTCLLPLAVTFGEPLCINLPVDRVLFENAQKRMHIWKEWYPHLHIVPIEAELMEPATHKKHRKKASLFSLGVDSYFSLLKYDEDAASSSVTPINDLIFIGGFDNNLDRPGTFEKLQEIANKAASELGKRLIVISTNMRYTRFKETDYSYLSQASILASALHALEGLEYKEVLLPSSCSFQQLVPYGSHPQTDVLFSTSLTKINHHGIEHDRVEKMQLVAQSDIAMQTLRPCWPLPSGENCRACSKCFRTMATLEILGALDKCTAFGKSKLDLEALANVYLHKRGSIYFEEIGSFAKKSGRKDIAEAIECSLKRSAKIEKLLGPFRRVKNQAEKLRGKPIIGKWVLTPLINNSSKIGSYIRRHTAKQKISN
jgi:hypothetical protein